jgi:hypothetical protein
LSHALLVNVHDIVEIGDPQSSPRLEQVRELSGDLGMLDDDEVVRGLAQALADDLAYSRVLDVLGKASSNRGRSKPVERGARGPHESVTRAEVLDGKNDARQKLWRQTGLGAQLDHLSADRSDLVRARIRGLLGHGDQCDVSDRGKRPDKMEAAGYRA